MNVVILGCGLVGSGESMQNARVIDLLFIEQ
jgi:hypothetical protein